MIHVLDTDLSEGRKDPRKHVHSTCRRSSEKRRERGKNIIARSKDVYITMVKSDAQRQIRLTRDDRRVLLAEK